MSTDKDYNYERLLPFLHLGGCNGIAKLADGYEIQVDTEDHVALYERAIAREVPDLQVSVRVDRSELH
jgi:hypothetical protein